MTEGSSKKRQTCGELRKEDVGKQVFIAGWVYRRRDLGGIIFLEIRDREGVTQVSIAPGVGAYEVANPIRTGFCVAVSGEVVSREEHGGAANPNLKTGEIEISAEEIILYNASEPLPFPLDENTDTSEPVRLKYRYLDLRRPNLFQRMKLRSDVCRTIRNFYCDEGFLEIETPYLMKSTPEGARDYLVPSRLEKGSFYALPQSPQIYKQLLMIGGMEKYFQIARCFRDEDLRADRQPEFTQLDFEMSFIERDDVLRLVERLFQKVFQEHMNTPLPKTFPRMTFTESMEKYGEDKPDLRYGMELISFEDVFRESSFRAFSSSVASGGTVKGILVKGQAEQNRSWISSLEKMIQGRGAKGLAWFKYQENELQSPLLKFLSEEEQAKLKEVSQIKNGDLLLVVADPYRDVVHQSLSVLRRHLADLFALADPDAYEFTWVLDFPVAKKLRDGSIEMMANPFTMPHPDLLHHLESEPDKAFSLSYDLVLNGYELGSGSIRINQPEVQERVFKLLGIEGEEMENDFGFFRTALKFGAPPHGGMGLGLDRILMIMTGDSTLRDIIAFPKTKSATCLMTQAPNPVKEQHLNELGIRIQAKEKKENEGEPSI